MASFAKTFFLFLLLVLFSSLQIQARESKFFSKFIHTSTKEKISESNAPHFEVHSGPPKSPKWPPSLSTVVTAVPMPAPAPAPAPAFAPTESESSNGLYGNVGSKQFTPTKGTETIDESDLLNEELSAENYETRNQNSNYNNNVYSSNYNDNGYTNNKGYTAVNYNNNVYSNNFNTNGYETEKQGMSDTRFMENYQTSKYNNEYSNSNGYTSNYNNNGYSSNYNTNGYETDEKQGMSDTRYYLKGKYFYDVQNEKYPTGYESERQTEGKYGNTRNVNEFNTMEEYENQQGYQENYVP